MLRPVTYGDAMSVIYVEEGLLAHPRVERIIRRRGEKARVIPVAHYREVFNPKGQNFRRQKNHPALILAEKTGRRVLPTPPGFGIGGVDNFYFSTLLNCLYDCRYCFLQGMYQSAHDVLFVNYEDFQQEVSTLAAQHPGAYFFTGYDSDSLAYEPVSQFVTEFYSFFASHSSVFFELRTKSTQIEALLSQAPLDNVIVAFSFTPALISQQLEHKVPSFERRIKVMRTLAQRGWKIGLRLDPLIYASDYKILYQELVHTIFKAISPLDVHSVSLGPLRFPQGMFKKLVHLYPEERLFAQPLVRDKKQYTYPKAIETQMRDTVLELLRPWVDSALIFRCYS